MSQGFVALVIYIRGHYLKARFPIDDLVNIGEFDTPLKENMASDNTSTPVHADETAALIASVVAEKFEVFKTELIDSVTTALPSKIQKLEVSVESLAKEKEV